MAAFDRIIELDLGDVSLDGWQVPSLRRASSSGRVPFRADWLVCASHPHRRPFGPGRSYTRCPATDVVSHGRGETCSAMVADTEAAR